MSKTEMINYRASKFLASKSTKQLIDIWEWTEKANSEDVPTIRGWLMDEFEYRDPDGFNEWLESDALDTELKNYIKA